ncbi:MAG: 4Fe-4S dicluster domain-containing protein [SAR324 cluster bacterium]|nr:4Fe-4S dicluster domain-containing protein [SAR324 cluster bacterium]
MSDGKFKKLVSRRKFIKTSTVVAVGGVVTFGAVSVPLLRSEKSLLRPPGALAEERFLASCIKCGQCLQVCPPKVIDLAGIDQGFGIGTPYIVAREGGCILCAGLPCVLACPTGALDHQISGGKEAEMGLAVISQPQTCLSIQGVNDLVYTLEGLESIKNREKRSEGLLQIITKLLERLSSAEKQSLKEQYDLIGMEEISAFELRNELLKDDLQRFVEFVKKSTQAKRGCRICLEECPIKNEQTIRFIKKPGEQQGTEEVWPTVQKTCVGCGMCEEKCPTPQASITIVPRLKWTGNG